MNPFTLKGAAAICYGASAMEQLSGEPEDPTSDDIEQEHEQDLFAPDPSEENPEV